MAFGLAQLVDVSIRLLVFDFQPTRSWNDSMFSKLSFGLIIAAALIASPFALASLQSAPTDEPCVCSDCLCDPADCACEVGGDCACLLGCCESAGCCQSTCDCEVCEIGGYDCDCDSAGDCICDGACCEPAACGGDCCSE